MFLIVVCESGADIRIGTTFYCLFMEELRKDCLLIVHNLAVKHNCSEQYVADIMIQEIKENILSE